MPETVIIKPSVQQQFDRFVQSGRVLFLSAPCGFGKSTVANVLLKGRTVLRMSAGAPDFSLAALPKGWDVLLIDDFQFLQEESDRQCLCEQIRANGEKRFVLLSRGVVPGYLQMFQFAQNHSGA